MSEKTPVYSTVHAPLGSPTGPGLWRHKNLQLPAYIQNVAQALRRSGHTESQAIQLAIGVVRNWAEGKGKVHPEVRLASQKAIAEFEALRAESKAETAAGKGKSTKAAQPAGDGLALAASWNPSQHPRAAAGGAAGGQFVPLGQANSASSAAAQADPASQRGYRTAMTMKTGDRNKYIKGLSSGDLEKLSRIAYSSSTSDPHIVALRVAVAKELAHRGLDVRGFGAHGTDLKVKKPPKPGAKPRAPKPPKPGAKPKTPAPQPGSTHLAQETTVDRLALAGMAGTAAFTTPMNDSQSGSKVTVSDTSKAGVSNGAGSTPKPGRAKLTAEKRKQGAKDGTALKDGSFMIEDVADVKAAVKAEPLSNLDSKAVRNHIVKRAKAVGGLRHVPPHWAAKKTAQGK